MTDLQGEKISNFINEAPEKIVNKMFEELFASLSVYFAGRIYKPYIDQIYGELSVKGFSIEEISAEVKKNSVSEEKIYAMLMNDLTSSEEHLEIFAKDCVVSMLFNPEYPKEIIEQLNINELDEKDFSINLITSFSEEFVDFFINDSDIEEWKNNIIDYLVAIWANEKG